MLDHFKKISGVALVATLAGCSYLPQKQPVNEINATPITASQKASPSLSPTAQEYVERFGILNTKLALSMTDEAMRQEIKRLAEQVADRYKSNDRANINTITLHGARYTDRPHHYTLRPMSITIARGDSIVTTAKSTNFRNDGVQKALRITLSDNNRLYINGQHVDQIYKGGVFEARSESNDGTVFSAIATVSN